MQVLFNGNVELPEDVSDHKNGDLLIGGNNNRPHLILAPVNPMTPLLSNESTADRRDKFLEGFMVNRGQASHLSGGRDCNGETILADNHRRMPVVRMRV